MKIILGSQSKLRKKILEEMGLEFEVMPADIDERAIRFENPQELVISIAKAKAEALKPKISGDAILITSDLVVFCNGGIREKPKDEKEARQFLESYNIYPAKTIGAIVVINLKTGKTIQEVDITQVFFNHFSKEDIDNFIKEGDVFNMAGGFSVEGELWMSHIERIEGDKDSARGMSKNILSRLIEEVIN
ncbi:MAG: Maf family protein [Candidatus Pacebacteria bacterium]|nr:Maf family protein [Candidatus Paceibacterota bacterium]